MEEIPITGLEELEHHLHQLVEAPDTLLNAKLLDEVELQLTDTNIPPLLPRLLPPLTQILPTYPHDPTLLTSLTLKLLGPITFTQALTLASEETLTVALQSPAPSANILAIKILHKASRTPGDTAILSIMKSVVAQLIRTWLSTPDVGVGESATKALGDLLDTDCDRRKSASIDTRMNGIQLAAGNTQGQGLLWRRIFGDREIYSLIFELCSSETTGTGPGQLDERQKSLAQARLLRLLPRLAALDFKSVTQSSFPDVESNYDLPPDELGLIYFAGLHLVDKSDILMHLTLIDFFGEFLGCMSVTEIMPGTLEYLRGLMRRATEGDEKLYRSLQNIASDEEARPELVDLLVRLNESR